MPPKRKDRIALRSSLLHSRPGKYLLPGVSDLRIPQSAMVLVLADRLGNRGYPVLPETEGHLGKAGSRVEGCQPHEGLMVEPVGESPSDWDLGG